MTTLRSSAICSHHSPIANNHAVFQELPGRTGGDRRATTRGGDRRPYAMATSASSLRERDELAGVSCEHPHEDAIGALPGRRLAGDAEIRGPALIRRLDDANRRGSRSEEHTSELQSPCNLVCR